MPTETPSGDDITTTTHQLNCPVCGTVFTRIRRQRFCSPNCQNRVGPHPHTPTTPRRPCPRTKAPQRHHGLSMPHLRQPLRRRTMVPRLHHPSTPRRLRRILPPLRRTSHHRRPHPGHQHTTMTTATKLCPHHLKPATEATPQPAHNYPSNQEGWGHFGSATRGHCRSAFPPLP